MRRERTTLARERERSAMLIISRNGKTTVITGWRAWLAWTALSVLAAVAIVVGAALLMGFALTLAVFFLFVVPLAIAITLVMTWLRGLR
jgi:hypothetical protein